MEVLSISRVWRLGMQRLLASFVRMVSGSPDWVTSVGTQSYGLRTRPRLFSLAARRHHRNPFYSFLSLFLSLAQKLISLFFSLVCHHACAVTFSLFAPLCISSFGGEGNSLFVRSFATANDRTLYLKKIIIACRAYCYEI